MLMTMMKTTALPPSTRRSSDGEWAVHLPRICELYYGLRYTLEDTQRIIQQETGFYATLRMYKDRIRNMAVHPKKISMQKYQAMDVVANDFISQGVLVHFIGPSGFQFFKRTPAQITKQLRRPHCLRPITSDQARDILQQSSIQAIVENTAWVATPAISISTAPHLMVESASFGVEHPSQFPLNHYHTPISRTSPAATVHPVLQQSVRNHPADTPGGIPYMLGQRPVNEAWTTARGFPGPKPERLSLAGMTLVPERLQKLKSPDEAAESYDFVADFNALSLLNPDAMKANRLAAANPDRTLPPPSSIQLRQLAVEFAAPFFLACFQPAYSRNESAFSRGRAMDRFKYILTANPENQYTLPLLNWMSTVLSSNDKPDLLKDFTFECCQVLDTCRDAGFPLSTPFRYMLAFCNNDTAGQEYHGAQLAQGTQRLIQLYGADHPNVLVNEYFHAWHLMMQPAGWADAKRILETCLTKSEKVMGTRDLITINCLVVLGRGCSENGLHAQAKAIFQDVLGRFSEPGRPLQAYHLLILGRLATEEQSLGELTVATERFGQVYEGRMRLISAASVDTRAALNAYTMALQRIGQPNKAASAQQIFDQELELSQQRVGPANKGSPDSPMSPSFSKQNSSDPPSVDSSSAALLVYPIQRAVPS